MTDCLCLIWKQRRIRWNSIRQRECLVPRHSSVRVPHKDHQSQRRIRKVRKSRIERRAVVSQEKRVNTTTDSRPMLPCLHDRDAASRRWMAILTTNTRTLGSACTRRRSSPPRVDMGLIENPSCTSTRLRVLGQLACTNVNM